MMKEVSLLNKLPAALSNGREANTRNFKGAVLLQHRTIQQFHINFSLMAFLKSCKLTQITSFQSRVKESLYFFKESSHAESIITF